MRKVLFALHPSFIQRNNWPLLSALKRNLELAKVESWSSEVKPIREQYVLNPTINEAKAMLSTRDHRPLVFDIETVRETGEIVCIGVARLGEHHHVVVIPWAQPFKMIFRACWTCDAIEKIGHNSEAFDIPRVEHALNGNGECRGTRFDTIIAHALCWPDLEHGLDDLALDYSRLLPWKGDKRDSLERYCAKDIHVTGDCAIALKRELKELGLERMMVRQMRSAPVLHEMCSNGVRVDKVRQGEVRDELTVLQEELTIKLSKCVATIGIRFSQYEEAYYHASELDATAEDNWVPGKKREMGKLKTKAKRMRIAADKLLNVNWASHKQKKELLYNTLKAPVQKTKEGAVTTNAEAIIEIRRRCNDPKLAKKLPYPDALKGICDSLNEWSEYDTVIGTFTHYEDDVLKPDLRLFGTRTGRLACRNPNLQNLPKRKPYSWKVRSMFVPVTDGNVFSARDYSQIEARLQAHLSGEPVLVKAFSEGLDVHRYMASLCLSNYRGRVVTPDEVTDSERLLHKRAVYLESYGGGWLKLQRTLAGEGVHVTPQQAKDTLNTLRIARPVLTQYREALLAKVAQVRMLRTPFGRIRWFLGPAYGEVLNFPFQSTVADVILHAMCEIDLLLPEGAKLVLQVHDELVVEHPPGLTDEVQEVMRSVMEAPIEELNGWSCPTDGKTGPNLAFR